MNDPLAGLEFESTWGMGLDHLAQVEKCGHCQGRSFVGPPSFPVPCIVCSGTGQKLSS